MTISSQLLEKLRDEVKIFLMCVQHCATSATNLFGVSSQMDVHVNVHLWVFKTLFSKHQKKNMSSIVDSRWRMGSIFVRKRCRF